MAFSSSEEGESDMKGGWQRRDVLLGLSLLPVAAALPSPLLARPADGAASAPPPSGGVMGDGRPLAEAELGMTLTPDQVQAGVKFLKKYPSVDVHAHPGRFFLQGLEEESVIVKLFGPPFVKGVARDMQHGRISAALFAGVSDLQIIGLTEQGIRAHREFREGEAYADYQRQLKALKEIVRKRLAVDGRDVDEIARAHRKKKTACVFSIEGGDFFEDRLERVQEAYEDGVRSVTIVHYHVNQIGDIQTEAPVHNGLTPLGREIVKEMNRVGMVIDLAHATYDVCKHTVDISTRPVLLSHTNLQTEKANHPRLITADHARMIAQNGGIIGAVPSGIGKNTFADFIDSIREMVDVVGPDHVAIGTDMDANYKPVFKNYQDWPLIPAALLAKGYSEAEVAKIIGGNFLRIFSA